MLIFATNKTNMKTRIGIFSILFLLLFAVACKNNDPSINATRLRISLTDAPAEPLILSELNVHIEQIQVSTSDSENGAESWQNVEFSGGTYNILPLTNGKQKQIVDQYFPVGVLRKIKIVFGSNTSYASPTSTNKIPLELSQQAKEGIVLNVNANLYPNYISNIIIDINGLLSIQKSNDTYIFNPVIRSYAETFGGSLKGYIEPREAAPLIIFTKDAETLHAIPEPKDGMFLISGLAEGEWKISVIPANAEYKDTTFVDSVFTGKIRDLKSKIVLKKIEKPQPDNPNETEAP